MVDRVIIYPGQIPLDTDLLNAQRMNMIAHGFLAQAAFGTGPIVSGFALTQTTVASMTVNVGPGAIIYQSTVDGTAFGSLAPDTTDALMKIGINLTATQLTLTAPGTAGQSQNYLIQAALSETDTGSTVLPYYNASNPSLPYSGPANAGTSQNTQRVQRANINLKAGTPATTGTQTTPATDSGFVALYVLTIANGQSTITTANIASGNPNGNALVPTAPFVQQTLGSITRIPTQQVISATGAYSFTIPAGVYRVKVTAIGGGGSGAGASAGQSGGGGGAGGTGIKWLAVTPGLQITGSVGAGANGGTTGTSGSTGGNTTVIYNGTTYTASGGLGGLFNAAPAGAIGGLPTGFDINDQGGTGGDGQNGGNGWGGFGGASSAGGGGRGSAGGGSPANGVAAGSGGAGSYSSASTGGNGANGRVIIEY